MPIHAAGGISAAGSSIASPGKEKFSHVMHAASSAHARPPPAAKPGAPAVETPKAQRVAQMMDRVQKAQARLDHIFKLAQSGRTFTPAELLAFQAQVCEASQQLDLATRVVDKATSGVKQVLQTQV